MADETTEGDDLTRPLDGDELVAAAYMLLDGRWPGPWTLAATRHAQLKADCSEALLRSSCA